MIVTVSLVWLWKIVFSVWLNIFETYFMIDKWWRCSNQWHFSLLINHKTIESWLHVLWIRFRSWYYLVFPLILWSRCAYKCFQTLNSILCSSLQVPPEDKQSIMFQHRDQTISFHIYIYSYTSVIFSVTWQEELKG